MTEAKVVKGDSVAKVLAQALDLIVEQLDWEANVDPNFKDNHYLEPIVADRGKGWVDHWIVYGRVAGKQLFSSKRLTLEPDAKCVLKDPGPSSWITVQGKDRMGKLNLQTPRTRSPRCPAWATTRSDPPQERHARDEYACQQLSQAA
jgi:hypothetical protein